MLLLVRDLKPDVVVLHGTWEQYIDNVAQTVAALKQQIDARVVVLGPVPTWRRGLPNEILRYFLLYHELVPERWIGAVSFNWYDKVMLAKLVPAGAEFISAWELLCNADGCLTRTGDSAGDISMSDAVHLTEKGSVYLIGAVIDDVLDGPATAPKRH